MKVSFNWLVPSPGGLSERAMPNLRYNCDVLIGTPSVIPQTADTVLSDFPKMGVLDARTTGLLSAFVEKLFSWLNDARQARLQLGLLRKLHAMASNRSYFVLQLVYDRKTSIFLGNLGARINKPLREISQIRASSRGRSYHKCPHSSIRNRNTATSTSRCPGVGLRN